MPRQNRIRFVRGTEAEIIADPPQHGEPTIATDTDRVYVGTAAARIELARESDLNAHIAATAVHGATSAATPNRAIQRDAAGRAKIAAPAQADDIAQRAQADAVQTNLNTHAAAADPHSVYALDADLTPLRVVSLPFIMDGGGVVIATGIRGWLEVPFACTTTGWTIVSDVTGSIVVEVRRATYAAFPTMTLISGTEHPTLSSARKNQDLTLTTWIAALAAGDILEFAVISVALVTRVMIALRATRN